MESPESNGRAAARPVYRVLVVDDLPEIRLMLRTRLRMMPDVEVVGEASNGREAVRLVAALAPDAVVLDLEMPVMRGDEAIPRMRDLAPGIRILLYSAADEDTLARINDDAKPDAAVNKGGALVEVVDQLRALLEMGPYDVLRLVLGTIPLDQAVTVFDTWVGLNVRIFESLARGDELERAQLGGATVEELEALIGVYAHLGDNLQKAAREGEAEVVPIIHLLRTTAAAARRALVAFDDVHLEEFYRAWDYRVPAHAATALNEMRDRLLEALPTSSAEEPEEPDADTNPSAVGEAGTSIAVLAVEPELAVGARTLTVDQLMRRWVVAINSGNSEALTALYAAGAEHHAAGVRQQLSGRLLAAVRLTAAPTGFVVELDLAPASPAGASPSGALCCVLEVADGLITGERDYTS